MRSTTRNVASSRLDFLAAMNKAPEPAPTGKWEMPKPHIAQMLGYFVMAWSLIEAAIEVGIGKQLGIKPLESSIVTAGLMFKARASILASLLNRDPSKNATALSLLKEIQAIEDRNDILHSVVGSGTNQIWFNRRKTKNKFSSKIERYNWERLSATVLSISQLAGDLMAALDVTQGDYLKFFQDSHNAANKPSVSP